MEFRELAYFAEVVDRGSITRGAETIGISQPALTKCIRQLEERLGVKLLERGATGVRPTVYGEALYVRAKSISAEVARARAEIDELSGTNAGSLAVGVLPSQAASLLAQAAVHVAQTRPRLKLQVVEKSRDDLLSGLRRGEFDLIISVIEEDDADPALIQRVLVRDRPRPIVKYDHPATRLKKVRVQDLAHYPWILPPPDSTRRGHMERMFKELGINLPAGIIECHSISFMKAVVMQSDHVGILPNNVPTLEEEAGLIKAIALQDLPAERAIGVLHRSDRPLSEGARSLVRALRRSYRGSGTLRPSH